MIISFREHITKPLTRSGKWRTVRKKFLRKYPNCCICGKKANHLHHIKPFHEHPELELNNDNLASMCRKHHFIYGHCENWKRHNYFFAVTVELIGGMYRNKFKENGD